MTNDSTVIFILNIFGRPFVILLMKTKYRGVCLLIAGMCLAGTAARAEFVQTINIRLTARQQGVSNSVGSVSFERIKTVRVTTQDVLRMLGTATTNDFTGATLVSIDLGASFQVRRGTNILADVSSFIAEETSEDAHTDVFDQNTGKEAFHAFWTRTFTIDDGAGNRIQLTGLVDDRYTATAADFNGNQRISEIENFNGAGTGTLDGAFAVFNGTMLFSGRAFVHSP